MYIQYACMYIHMYVCIMVEWMWVLHVPYVYFAQVLVCCIHLKTAEDCTLENVQSCHSTYACVSLSDTDWQSCPVAIGDRVHSPLLLYSDSLKACLATAIDCNATSQSTVKLVSTNLIANGKLIGEFIWAWDLHVNSISHPIDFPLDGWQFQAAIPSHMISSSKTHPSWLCFSPIVSLFLT